MSLLLAKARYLEYLREHNPKQAKEWEDRVAKYTKYEILTYLIIYDIFIFIAWLMI